MSDAYARAGVDTGDADAGVAAIVGVLKTISTGSPSRVVPLPGHFAAVLKLDDRLGLALCTDGVGSKVVVAEQTGRLDTVGIDCVAMNVNDLICVGARPIALVDYLAVEESDPSRLAAIAQGLKRGAELSGVEIPGGELAQLPELIRGHPSPNGFDICAAAIGTVDIDRIVDGATLAPGQTLIGIPSSGIHSNGLTLAREVLRADSAPDARPDRLNGLSVADVLLEPTAIYVRAILELLESGLPVTGLFHLTGGGLLNLLRLNESVGFRIDEPLDPHPVFELISEWGDLPPSEMYEVFNMGCGFAVAVDREHAPSTIGILERHHPGTRVIGEVTVNPLIVEMPGLGVVGDPSGLRAA